MFARSEIQSARFSWISSSGSIEGPTGEIEELVDIISRAQFCAVLGISLSYFLVTCKCAPVRLSGQLDRLHIRICADHQQQDSTNDG